ncbi:TPA: hypothetical protein ACKP9S_002832 [Pseudomonas aeruginosa]
MLRHLIIGATYKSSSNAGERHFRPIMLEGAVALVDLSVSGSVAPRSVSDLTDHDWATIDFVGEPPLLEGRQYLVLVRGTWRLATWCVSRTRVDIPTQFYFHGWGVPFGSVVERTVLVPLPTDSRAWRSVSIPDCLPTPGEEVLHVDRGEQFARSSIYDNHTSRRYQNLNGLCFGPDNPAQAVSKWLPIASLIAA